MQTAFKSSHKFQEEWDREMSLARGALASLGTEIQGAGEIVLQRERFPKAKVGGTKGNGFQREETHGHSEGRGGPLSFSRPSTAWVAVCVWGGVASVNRRGTVCTVHTSHRFLSCMFH